jgi:Tfp pilus assembly major pilin PilA
MAVSSSPPRTGLTLIEVLIVLGIIVLLAGILIPTIGWMRTKARQASCTANLAQLGAATRIYAELEGGRLPASQNWKATRQERSSAWFNQLPRLMSERKIRRPGSIFHCPSFDGASPGLIRNEVPKSYKMNEELDRVKQGRVWRHRPFFIDRISDAKEVVLFFDGLTTGGKGQWGYGGASEVDDSRHSGWIGVLMGDGRVVRPVPTDEARDGSASLRWISVDWQ